MPRLPFATLVSLFVSDAREEERPEPPSSDPDPRAPLRTFQGSLASPSHLRVAHRTIELIGWQTELFADLIGAEIFVAARPALYNQGCFVVEDFEILAVDGLPVFDGRLVRTLGQYFIYLRNGVRPVSDVPEGLAQHVGRRVWIAWDDGETVRYGLLERAG